MLKRSEISFETLRDTVHSQAVRQHPVHSLVHRRLHCLHYITHFFFRIFLSLYEY